MSGRPATARRARAGGFVLVGVVMMVLALTIIGLSLYSLSGYESQFFGRSLFDRQALYTASGGIELAKSMLSTPLGSPPDYRLSNVTRAIGREGIVSAVAWQDDPPDSSGPLVWTKDVHLRVGVSVLGATRTVEGTFSLAQPNSPYWRLFAASSIQYYGTNDGTLLAAGGAWQSITTASDSAWIRRLDSSSRIALTPTPPPMPAVTQFIVDHLPSPTSADTAWLTRDYNPATPSPGYANLYVDMDAGPGANDSRFFRAGSDTITSIWGAFGTQFDFCSGAVVHVRVRGTAIWIIPRGAYVEGEFRIERLPGATTANLIIVAGPNGRHPTYPNSGFWCTKGMWTTNNDVNVFLVSNGTVRIEDGSPSHQDMGVAALSIVANAVRLNGPDEDAHRLSLRYPSTLKPVAQDLYNRRLLPTVTGMQSGTFALQPGSWRQSPGLQ